MLRPIRALVAASMLFGLGWMAGHAQTRQPDFEIVVNAPTGDTKIACVRGCTLHWVERGIPDTVKPGPTFSYGCTAANGCSSGRVGGWVER
jgi:hypothetical protein